MPDRPQPTRADALSDPAVPEENLHAANGRSDPLSRLDSLSDQEIVRALRKKGALAPTARIRLQPLAGNLERRDYYTRAAFRVFNGTRSFCHLTVGRNLRDLCARTRAFARACPEITCRPLFRFRFAGWDYLGVEYFDGENLDTLARHGRISPAEAVRLAGQILATLEQTMRPSTPRAAAAEFDRLCAQICASPLFGAPDQKFLREVVLPFIRRGVLAGPPRRRWTNGDFISRNILVDGHGRVRLVDHEFAHNTHFFGEDWWRWHSFSNLPAAARDWPGLRDTLPPGDWLEVFFLLHQLRLVHETKGANHALRDARASIDRILAILASADTGYRPGTFLAASFPRAADSAPTTASAQLFWSTADGEFSEERSQSIEYAVNAPHTLRFTLAGVRDRLALRFDPADAPGKLEIERIVVRRGPEKTPLLALPGPRGWAKLRLRDGLLRLADTPALSLLCLHNDPGLLLPAVPAGDAPCDLVCEVTLHFTPDAAALPGLLQPEPAVTLLGSAYAQRRKTELRQTLTRLERAGRETVARLARAETRAREATALREQLARESEERRQILADLGPAATDSPSRLERTLARLHESDRAVALRLVETEAGAQAEVSLRREQLARVAEERQQTASELTAPKQRTTRLRHVLNRLERANQALVSSLDNERQLYEAARAQLDATRRDLKQIEEIITRQAGQIAGLEDLAAATPRNAHADLPEAAQSLDAEFRLLLRKYTQLRSAALQNLGSATNLQEFAAGEIDRLQTQLHQREAKIHRMQRSFSWRSTAWLRAMRRTVLDPVVGPRGSPPPAPAPVRFARTGFTPVPSPRFQTHIDYPREWAVTAGEITVRGWVFAEEPLRLCAVRARLGSRVSVGEYSLARPDVGAAFAQFPGANDSGFKITVPIENDDDTLLLEVADEDGTWYPFVHRSLRRDGQAFTPGSYGHWVTTHDTLTPAQLAAIKQRTASQRLQPLISIIMPVYNTPEKYLRAAIASVRAQVYEHWELCLADDHSTEPHVRALLEEFTAADPRIKVVFRERNGHIAAASNSALALATGDYVGLLDHDDELRPHALAEVVRLLNHRPDVQLIYSDEDKIDDAGCRFDPYFKSEWMPELFTGHNYLCHFCVTHTELLRELGGWRPGFDGAQDWDLQLRIVERVRPEQIARIPHVLYHWRTAAGSTALAITEKNYAVDAARRALTEHFARRGEKVDLIHLPGNQWRVRHALPRPAPLVSLVIPTRNGLPHLRRCLESVLQKTTYPACEIIVVDNGSDDPATLEYLAALHRKNDAGPLAHPNGVSHNGPHPHPSIRVLPYPHPFKYSAINNFAVRAARGEFVGLLNDDVEVITPEWLDEMMSHAARPGVGCVGAMLYYPDSTVQHAGVVLGVGGWAGHAFRGWARGTPGYLNRARLVQNYSAVTGACLVVRKSTYEAVGGLDETGLGVSLNDVDFCLKVRAAGFRNVWTPFAELYHHESASRGYEDTPEKQARFQREAAVLRQRWGALLDDDPAYNPNLTLATEDYALAYPPRTEAPALAFAAEITPDVVPTGT